MPSSKTTVGEKFQITEIELAWTDNGNKMFNVWYTRLDEGTKWFMRHWAEDELDAYILAMRKLEGAS